MVHTLEPLSDPHYLPHMFHNGQVMFVQIDRPRIKNIAVLTSQFMDDFKERVSVPVQEIGSVPANRNAKVNMIFHMGFCGSTLLVRALEQEGYCWALSEPNILADLGSLRNAPAQSPLLCQALEEDPRVSFERYMALPNDQMLREWRKGLVKVRALSSRLISLMARPLQEGEINIIKSTAFASDLLPEIYTDFPCSRHLLLFQGLEEYLLAVLRGGLFRRGYTRAHYRAVRLLSKHRIPMEHEQEITLTDLQVAGLAWMYQMGEFRKYLLEDRSGRVKFLQSDDFYRDPAAALIQLDSHFETGMGSARCEAIASGPVFGQHSKESGRDFNEESRIAEEETYRMAFQEEIEKVVQWVGVISQQSKLSVPPNWDVPRNLNLMA